MTLIYVIRFYIGGKDGKTIGQKILKEAKESKAKIAIAEAKDIHSWVENKLKEKIGIVARKLHITRSRNDQIAPDERMYLKEEVLKI